MRSLPVAHRAAIAVAIAAGLVAAAPKETKLVSRSRSETSVVTVKAVDAATRHLTIANAKGETQTVKVPAEYKRLADLKPGDRIKATYTAEVEVALAAANAPLPEDKASLVGARTVSGGPPGAGVASHITVSGAILAIDMAKHTLKVASPKGGEVHTIAVDHPEERAAMSKLKVGDKITARVTESLLLGVEPA